MDHAGKLTLIGVRHFPDDEHAVCPDHPCKALMARDNTGELVCQDCGLAALDAELPPLNGARS